MSRLLHALPALLALLLLGAHLLRWTGPLLLPPLLAALVLPFLRAPWAAWTLRTVLALACLEWLRTAWVLTVQRLDLGQPAGRMLAILLAVAALTAWAAVRARPARS